jgi:histidinol-phosphate/aromatic aminotransferase/cobyric acid decarboxylase-like protein
MSWPAELTGDGVILNDAGFVDAPSVVHYRVTRDGASSDAKQIGYGVNKAPIPSCVAACLKRIYAEAVDSRSMEYDDERCELVNLLEVKLLAGYLGIPSTEIATVTPFNGATEAISVISAYAARHRCRPVFPLPNYYGFDHSRRRWGLPDPVNYGFSGELSQPIDFAPRLLVDVLPNGVTGSVFTTPWHATSSDLGVLDLPFALPKLDPGAQLAAEIRSRISELPRWLICMTPSKDLSIPALRVGIVASSHEEFFLYAKADRFERGYSVNVATEMIAALHLALLSVAACGSDDVERLGQDMVAEFAANSIPFLTVDELWQFRAETETASRLFRDNLRTIDASGLFEPAGPAETPCAGYSGFRWLRQGFGSAAAFTHWIQATARGGLKLNPNELFGGSADSWQELYPNRYGIRVNLSVPAAELADNLSALDAHLKLAGAG